MEDFYEEPERRALSRGASAAFWLSVAGLALYGAYAIVAGLV